MVVGVAEDFTSGVSFDTEVTAIPVSGIYANSGVHPSINLNNLLAFLPSFKYNATAWDIAKTYNVYSVTRNRSDLVSKNGKIYQSIKAVNINHDPEEVNSIYWMLTNLESLRMKTFLNSVVDRVYSELNLTKRLVDSQFIYEGERFRTLRQLPLNYAAWVFEPKGSDYVSIRINQIAFTKSGTTPVNLYVINQKKVIQTVQITPSNGDLEFKDLGLILKGKGKFILAIDATEVFTNSGFNDPLRYEGFVCYPTNAIGTAPETADYSTYGVLGNGLGFNVTSLLDASVYIDNNINEFAGFIKATFEYMSFQMFLSNSNNRSNGEELIQMSEDLLKFEVMSTEGNSSYNRFNRQRAIAIKQLKKTFDTQLDSDTEGYLEVEEYSS